MKRVIVWITVLTLVLAGVFAMNACSKTDKNGVTYELNLENFNEVVAYGEEVDLSRITIIVTENGESVEVPVDASMVTTPADTTKIGAKLLKINYSGQSFSIPIVVKYRVEYFADGVKLETFYVLNSSELQAVEAPAKDGYVFSGWSAEIPDIITDNITVSAVYNPYIPTLNAINATYGDQLSSIQLPYTAIGSWQFDNAQGTVGNAGKQTFDVSFVTYATGEAIEKATLTVNVAKKEVVFSDVVDSFVYNGEEQKPTFTTDVPVQVDFYASGNANYTDAGTYEYYFEVNDPNYAGVLQGSFTIAPAKVTVKVDSYTMELVDAFPEVAYSVEGFDQSKLDLLAISLTNPADVVTGAGTYTLTATTSNPNIELTVVPGTLTVNVSTLDVGVPELLSYEASYGDTLEVLGFQAHPNGKWTWKSPTDLVGAKGQQKHIAVFVPNDSRYETVEYEVTITVNAKKLTIEIIGESTFVYDGVTEYQFSYIIKDANGNTYDLAVLGNEPCKNAGSYQKVLTLADPNYEATTVKTLVVNKATPVTDFSQIFTTNWATAPKLSDFQLPAGYAWVELPSTLIPGAGIHYYAAVYTPEDVANYNIVTGEFRIDVAKAVATINNVENSYSSIYDGNKFTFDAVTRSHGESELVFTYIKDGVAVEAPIDAGTYTVTIALPESANYLAAEASTTLTIQKADTPDVVTKKQNATYGDAISKIVLPTSTVGTWTLKNDPQTVGNAGTNTFVAVFTPANDNYNACEVEIVVEVARKSIDAPTISTSNATQVYTGATLNAGLANGEGYTVTDNGGVTVGTYQASVALVDGNYIWSDGTDGAKTITYNIVAATNEWLVAPTIPSWTYGDAGSLGEAAAKAGQLVIEYKLADADDSAYSTTLPTNAGAYVARFTVTDPNYNTLVETLTFTIAKKAIDAPTISSDKLNQVYTGAALSSGLSGTTEYTVTDNGGANAGAYTVIVSLKDKANYQWVGGNSEDLRYTYTVEKAQIVISDFSVIGWTYGQKANAPTATTNFGTVSFVYASAIDGEYTATVPTAAGTYYVKAIAQGNENLVGAESDPIAFTVEKASVTINGANDTYSKVYNAAEFTISGVTASNDAELTVVITKDGETVEKMLNAGEYTVTFSYAGDDNYLAAEKTVTVTIQKATNTEAVNTNQNAVYGDLASVIVLPTGVEGYWSIAGVDETTKVGNAGAQTFVAVFTPTTGNYNGREETITVNVAKATVKVPIVEGKEFDEQYHNSGLTNTELYTVLEDIGGIDHGTYQVVLTLNDPANYKWATTEEATVSVQYVISVAVNNWVDAPSIADSWEYESAGDTGYASALHGGVKIEYKLASDDDSMYSETLPTLPGKYVARFTTTDDNYTILSVVEHFEITKRRITAPTLDVNEFAYTGNTITAGIASNEFYTVTDAGAINVQSGLIATVTLNSEYYVWADGVQTLAREYTYSIVKANIVITDPVIEGWTYGGEANAPTSTNNFGQDVTYVYATTVGGEYTTTVPTNAGTYYVKAIAQGNENLEASESKAVSFIIAKAAAFIEGAQENYTADYTNSAYTITGVTASNGVTLEYLYTKNGESASQIWNAGIYNVTITLPETDNYFGDSVSVTVTINRLANNDAIPTYTAIYGDKLTSLALPTTTTGSWAWSGADAETTVGNAGEQYHTLIFTPADAENYEERSVTVSVMVSKKVVTTPAVPNASVVYNGTAQYTGIVENAIYTASNDGHTDIGTYTVTLTLVDPANYAWNTIDNESTTVEVSYTITKGTNAIQDISYTASWTYNETVADFTANALYGGIDIKYTSDDITYTTTRPTVSGSYKVIFTTTDPNCDAVVEVRTFTINQVVVPTPTVSAATTTYNGNKVTSGLTTNDIYTVIDEGGTDVATYTAVVKLNDTVNYKWSTTQDSEDITLTYTIKQATTKIEVIVAGWTYGAFQAPSVSVAEPALVRDKIVYQYSSDGGITWTTTPPEAIGSYLIRAELAGTNNYTAASIEAIAFNISPAVSELSDPSFAGGKFYKNQFTATTDGMKATFNGIDVAGTFTLGTPVFVDGTNASYVTVTFQPNDTANYAPVTKNIYFTFVSVAYINNNVAYGSIEDALAAAVSGDVVWVRPSDASLGAIEIRSDVTIPEGVTLLLPYGIDASGRNSFSGDTIMADLHGGACNYASHKNADGTYKHVTNQGNYNSEEDPSKCIVRVILAAGKTITNYGTLEIGGELSGGGAGALYAGQTAGKHATLVLDTDASIVSKSGSKIYAAGFIRERIQNNGSTVIIENGATIYQPYVVKDYISGQYAYAAYSAMSKNKITALNRFIFMNVSPTVRINYGGVMKVWASLFTGSTEENNTTTVTLIGIDNSAQPVIALTNSDYSYLVAKYDTTTEICDLFVYGGAKTYSFKITVYLSSLPISLDSADAMFPLSYHYRITLDNSEGQTEPAIFQMSQLYKLMTGAELTVEEGAVLNIGTLIVYESYVDECAETASYKYPDKGPAILTVNGELHCDVFGGKIYSTANGAKVVINKTASYTAYEPKTYKDTSLLGIGVKTIDTFTEIKANAVLVDATAETAANIITIYKYTDGKWVAQQIHFETEGGSVHESIDITADLTTYPTLPRPIKEGFAFLGWFYNDVEAKAGEALLTTEPHTLVAKWVSGEKVTLDANGGSVGEEAVYLDPASPVYPVLPEPTRTGYKFLGWYYGDVLVQEGDELQLDTAHTLTAQWEIIVYTITVSKQDNATVTVTVNGEAATGATYGTTVTVTVTFSQTNSKTLTVKQGSTTVFSASDAGTYTFEMPAGNVTIEASSKASGGSCVAAGTLITLADGTQKKVEDLTMDDVLLVFNHETGEYEAAGIIFIENDGWNDYNVITLTFSDGTITKIIYEHALFDLTLGKYVYITEQNYADFIGHEFAVQGENGFERVTMTDATLAVEYTGCYSLVTVYHLNYFIDGLFSIPGGITGLFNMFEYGEDLVYDAEKMQADIEEYGLFTYEDFEEFLPYEFYLAFPASYLKVSIGKGLMTFDDIYLYIDQFLVKNGLM